MSTQSEITRLQTARDTIRAKAVELGIGISTDKLDALATKLETNLTNQGAVANNGAVSLTMDGLSVTSVTVPSGYHSGAGTVTLTNDIENALAAI